MFRLIIIIILKNSNFKSSKTNKFKYEISLIGNSFHNGLPIYSNNRNQLHKIQINIII